MRVWGSGCPPDGGFPCCWFWTSTPAPRTCVVPDGVGGCGGVVGWFGDCAGGVDCGWPGVVCGHPEPNSARKRKSTEHGRVRNRDDLDRGKGFAGMQNLLSIQDIRGSSSAIKPQTL